MWSPEKQCQYPSWAKKTRGKQARRLLRKDLAFHSSVLRAIRIPQACLLLIKTAHSAFWGQIFSSNLKVNIWIDEMISFHQSKCFERMHETSGNYMHYIVIRSLEAHHTVGFLRISPMSTPKYSLRQETMKAFFRIPLCPGEITTNILWWVLRRRWSDNTTQYALLESRLWRKGSKEEALGTANVWTRTLQTRIPSHQSSNA